MPVRHYQAIVEAYPGLPVELLPVPMDVPSGPRPKGLPGLLDNQSSTT
ncbi:MAG: hypothetical protein FWD79_04440 [Desulfobulbus sp.]|nr:hypothetical protein [Desulfobulbus sp.]